MAPQVADHGGIEGRFPVLEIHPDNGSEFLNAHLVRFWKEMVKGVTLSRSRPFHKNDNRFVEQKNSTLVRAYLGLARFDTAPQTNAINQLYEKMWLYYNFFQPVMRLREKTTEPLLSAEGQPFRIKRRFDQARTPFHRLSETDAISEERKEQLRTLRDQVNPRQLRQEIYQLIDHHIFLLPPAVPGNTEDVFETLSTPAKSQKGEGIPVTFSFDWTRGSRGGEAWVALDSVQRSVNPTRTGWRRCSWGQRPQ